MTALGVALLYVTVACTSAAWLRRRFGTSDTIVVAWLSVLWPFSLLVFAVLLPLERTRFASSRWRQPADPPPGGVRDGGREGRAPERASPAVTDDRGRSARPEPPAEGLRGRSHDGEDLDGELRPPTSRERHTAGERRPR